MGGINLYAYAGLNPINAIDPFGLLVSDVEGIWSDILTRYAGEIRPSGSYIFTTDYGPGNAGTDPFSGNIRISEYYRCENLSQDEFIELYGMLLHEMMHSTDLWWRIWLDRGDGPPTKHHKSIYQRTAYEMGSKVEIDVEKSIASGKIIPIYPFWGLSNKEVIINEDARNPNNIKHDVIKLYDKTRIRTAP